MFPEVSSCGGQYGILCGGTAGAPHTVCDHSLTHGPALIAAIRDLPHLCRSIRVHEFAIASDVRDSVP